MKLKAVCILNFLAISDARVELDDKGLVLIQGENLDDSSANSNGTGKSSIVDAICWALYGTTARGVSGDAVVNKTEGKDCAVTVYLDDNGTTYSVTRYRKHNAYKNQTKVTVKVEGKYENISKGTEKETQKVINAIMGCSLDVFKAAVYAGQENMVDLPSLTDKQLKIIVEEAAGIERIEKAHELAKSEFNSVKTEYEGRQSKLMLIEDSIASWTGKLSSAEEEYSAFEEDRKKRYNDELVALEGFQKALNGLRSDLSEIDEESIMAEKKTLIDDVKAVREANRKQTKVCLDAEARIRTVSMLIETVGQQARDVGLQIKGYQKNPETAVCEICGAPLSKEKVDDIIKERKGKLAELLERLWGYRKEYQELCDNRPEMPSEESETDTSKVEALIEKLGKLDELKQCIFKQEGVIDMEKSRLKSIEDEKNPHASSLKMIKESLAEDKESADAIAKELEGLKKEYDLKKASVDVFSPSGVRALILDTVTPFLNSRTAEYLSVLSDGNLFATWQTLSTTAKGEVREKFSIDVSNNTGGETFASLSGGEKRKVRIATTLALQDLVSSRATKPIDLWIGDEIDNALDTAGLERLMTILNTKAKEKGTVLIISHTNLRDWCSNVITVKKSEGRSIIEG